MARRNLVVVLFLCACFLVPLLQSTPAHSANHFSTSTDLSQANATLRSLERALNRRKLDPEKLEEYLSTVDRILSQADKCIADTTSQMENTRAALRLLGPEVKDESRYVARERRSLLRDLDLLERRIADCRLIRFKAGNIKTRIQRAQTELKKHSLLRKHPDILALFRNEKARVHTLPDRFRRVFHRYTGFQGSPRLGPIAVGITGLLVLLAVVPIRRVFVKISSQLKNRTSYLRSIDTVMEITANRLPLLLLLCMFMLVVWITTGRDAKSSWILTASAGLFLFLSTRMAAELIFGILGSPRSPDSSREKAARSCKRRIVLLGGVGAVGFFVLAPPLGTVLSQDERDLFLGFFIPALTFLLTGCAWLLFTRIQGNGLRTMLRFLALSALLFITGAQWAGYGHIALFTLRGMLLTGVSWAGLHALLRITRDVTEGLAYGSHDWGVRFRKKFGVQEGKIWRGPVWTKAVLNLLLWTIWTFSLLWIWEIPSSYYTPVLSLLLKGFKIGTVNIVPVRIVAAFALFGLLWALSGYAKRYLDEKWLAYAGISSSAKDAVVTISGYVGFTVALMVGLAAAGMTFSNLALIAGALSVGIGFGLQNIVNNFVSGLILLFERPIKKGDWIVVGNCEGYVKKISVRSTIVETFDKADIIVPNSELISTQVTNWVHRDRQGRIRIPVGVAYGSDTELVKKLLLEVARNNSNVINNNPKLSPYVLFMGFGSSSLDFELRCFIKDINNRLVTISELNFSIDATFREHNISIPFPQHDVYIKEIPSK